MPNGQVVNEYRSYVLSLVFITSAAVVAQLVNTIVDQPYLDEVFHIPQARRYCQGKYHGYDPKLTTPPGLYIISIALSRARALLHAPPFTSADNEQQQQQQYCTSVSNLRLTSLIALLVLPWCLALYGRTIELDHATPSTKADGEVQWRHSIPAVSPLEAITRAQADPTRAGQTARRAVATRRAEVRHRRRKGWTGFVQNTLDDWEIVLDAHTVALLPPLWFFGFLYYTDVPSTLMVTLMFACAQQGQHLLASILGGVSMTLRQTNIVWTLFALGFSILGRLKSLGLDIEPLASNKSNGLFAQLASIGRLPVKATSQAVLRVVSPYIPLLIGSAVFVWQNGSIVLGDREHHQVSRHWVQPFYFAAFTVIFSWPTLLSTLQRTSKKDFLSPPALLSLSILVLVALWAIHNGTVVHPFLLADNRHYAFYVWRKVIRRTSWSAYALAGPYALCARMIWVALSQRHNFFWLVGFVACLCAAVVPSPLIEPRYFLIPYIVVRLSLTSRRGRRLVNGTQGDQVLTQDAHSVAAIVELLWSTLINVAALYLFLYRPFTWSDSTGLQRFMW